MDPFATTATMRIRGFSTLLRWYRWITKLCEINPDPDDPNSRGRFLSAMIDPVRNSEILRLGYENGVLVILTSLAFRPEIYRVTLRIRNYVLRGGYTEAWRLKESYRDPLALEAVAAAIIAQIAITMLGLDGFGNIHWTATAFAYASVVCGVLSTLAAFFTQMVLSELHSAEDVHDWLLTENNWGQKIPSIKAAAILTTPSRLLNVSIVCLFVALGTYIGEVYTRDLGSLQGHKANRAVLIFFVVNSLLVVGETISVIQNNSIPNPFGPRDKDVEKEERFSGSGGGSSVSTVAHSIEGQDVVREALRASVRAQEESLRAQKAVLTLLESQVQPFVGVPNPRSTW
ncbi:uncharacterized protein BDV14DRAFT_194854 [Aspergillus stella-maris]|uniref:uncharacterized protein n=1 Tax=Aspergillus stella-maris TaxID=1810926 RepID=UPI003CCD7440